MSQTIVNVAQDQLQKGQVATSHYVRDKTYKSADVDDIDFGELVVFGNDPEIEVRQPDPTAAAVTSKAYTIVSGVCTVINNGHGLEDGQKILVVNAAPSSDLNGEHFITIINENSFSFPTFAGDNTGTLDYSVPAFTQKDIAGIVVKPVTGGRAKRFSDGYLKYSFGQTMTVIKEADIALELGGTVSAQSDLYYVNTPGGSYPIHTFVGDDDSGNAVKIPARNYQAGVVGDIVLCRFNLDAVLGS